MMCIVCKHDMSGIINTERAMYLACLNIDCQLFGNDAPLYYPDTNMWVFNGLQYTDKQAESYIKLKVFW